MWWKGSDELCLKKDAGRCAKLLAVLLRLVEVFQWTGLRHCDKWLLCVMTGDWSLWHSLLGCHADDHRVRALSVNSTADMPPMSVRCSGCTYVLLIMHSCGCLSPGLFSFVLLIDTDSIHTWSIRGPEYHLNIIKTITNNASLGPFLFKANFVQRYQSTAKLQLVIYHVKLGVVPLFLYTWMLLKLATVSRAHTLTHVHCCGRKHSLIIQLISSAHAKLLSEPEISDLLLI